MDTERTIGEIVAEDYRTARIFEKNGVDFCCNGNRRLVDVCIQSGKNLETLSNEIDEILNSKKEQYDFKTWPLDLLVDYIEKKHHRYVELQIPVVQGYVEKIEKVHGKLHPELLEIKTLFLESSEELLSHMKKEESTVFPQIRKMVQHETVVGAEQNASFGGLKSSIDMLMNEHNTEGDRFRKIASLSNDYTPPLDACNTYMVAYSLLKEFEDDLHLHIHLENNILFPKATAFADELMS
ncbi:MAG: iron-sulfur cluster repair di-iron protein [Saprospiraceae bacterium]